MIFFVVVVWANLQGYKDKKNGLEIVLEKKQNFDPLKYCKFCNV